MKYIHTYESPLGTMIMLGTDVYITDLFFDDEKHAPAIDIKKYEEKVTGPFEVTCMWLDAYFKREKPFLVPPIELHGTEFQQKVWRLLQSIPYGKTTTYKVIATQVAKDLGKEKMSAQAVGGAVGRNPISLIIPCHRVLGSNGSLTGYAGGIHRKKYMLELENR